ncbi:retrotransposon protein putative Ty1-copia subclass [Trifolium medium]|uniref:Retrotransposon protein putative Ty1-copia subclass n=1 Tax=Trifolium medium TaxID=97028 RepID=A0A392QGY9_9FABA|nr:retrotransposon protein putative Ty1-copia subclass [Trifolium medium]
MDDEDKAIILLCSLPGSYDHLVTTLTYDKDSITLTSITSAVLSHGQRRQNTEGGSQGEGFYVQGIKTTSLRMTLVTCRLRENQKIHSSSFLLAVTLPLHFFSIIKFQFSTISSPFELVGIL